MLPIRPISAIIASALALLTVSCPDDIIFVDAFPPGCEQEPVFDLLSPTAGQEIDGDVDGDGALDTNVTLRASVDVGIFQIVDNLGDPAADCEGHFHVFVDNILVDRVGGTDFQVDLGASNTVLNPPGSTGLADGPHTLTLQVHNNDHSRVPLIEPLSVVFDLDLE